MTKTSRIKFRYQYHPSHALWLIIFLLSFFLQLFDLADSWRFNRGLVAQGDVWLLFSGHMVHLNWSHWLLNMAGLAIVAFFFSTHASFRQWMTVILTSACVISAGLWWWMPDIRYYVGLSGILHGLFLYGALREIHFYPASGYVLTAVLLAKLGWEFFNGALPGSEEMAGGRVLTEAHLLGAIGGALVWLSEYLFNAIKSRFM
ncbi:MAG: rhombosortase [Gammaproteobacteria bacterium]|jgi:rhomboid family GlyGly-CTERM serine protease|nr:rhombosortase [Gammaproteobacteria bacterium]